MAGNFKTVAGLDGGKCPGPMTRQNQALMKTQLNFLAAGIFLAALGTGFGQPILTTQPQSQTNVAGTDATFSVAATGAPPLNYQWQFYSSPLSNQTNATLVKTNVRTADAGSYTVVVTNSEGAVTSLVATLAVLVPPSITKQPTNQSASRRQDSS